MDNICGHNHHQRRLKRALVLVHSRILQSREVLNFSNKTSINQVASWEGSNFEILNLVENLDRKDIKVSVCSRIFLLNIIYYLSYMMQDACVAMQVSRPPQTSI